MELHRAGGSFIGRIDIDPSAALAADHETTHNKKAAQKATQWALILDNSASMGQWSARVVQHVFPALLRRLGVSDNDKLLLILFASTAEVFDIRACELPHFKLPQQGSTQMRDVFAHLPARLTPGRRTNILVVSDGAVHDQEASVAAASAITAQLTALMPIVTAAAVRLITSARAEPDTRALAAWLQFNTAAGERSAIADLDVHRLPDLDGVVDDMASLFDGAATASAFTLTTDPPAIHVQPWDATAVGTTYLKPGPNAIFLAAQPDTVLLNGERVRVTLAPEPVTTDTLAALVGDRVDAFLAKLRVLKVIASEQATEEMQRIVAFWQGFEATLAPPADFAPLLAEGGLRSRRLYLLAATQRKLKSITNAMRAVANDDRVARLNASQQADYLRTTQVGSKNGRGLAKRAEAAGLDFDRTVRDEIRAMAAHLHELEGVDDSQWSVSFFSQATTLDGVREVCALASADAFDSLLAIELLELLNLVGVCVAAPVGDFPDPMTYRVDALLPGACVSVADLTVAEKGRGGRLLHPTSRQPIANAVPLFEDVRLQRFLQRHAPSTLECIASVGMRRMICEVPKTLPYTMCAAIWQLVGAMDADRSKLHVELLATLAPSYELSLKDKEGTGYFDYLMPLLVRPRHPEEKEFFLNFNGITNCIQPLWRLACEGEHRTLPRILRSLYSFEIYQVVRRKCKNQPEGYAMDTLRQLLGVDFAARGTPLPAPFTRPAELRHCEARFVDEALFGELKRDLSFVHACTLIVPLFSAVRQPDPAAAARAVPPVSDASVCAALALDYDLDTFLLYNLVHALLFRSKQERIDRETGEPLLPDLGANGGAAGAEACARFLEAQYAADYHRRLGVLAGQELRTLQEEHLADLLAAPTADLFNGLLKAGLERGPIAFKIANSNSAGASELRAALLSADVPVPARGQKLWTLLSGTDRSGAPVWNGGNMLRTPLAPLREALIGLGKHRLLAALEKAYKTRRAHVYRAGAELPNRQGHSNDKPSYFAFGHASLESFARSVDAAGWAEYEREHCGCCGVARLARALAAERLRCQPVEVSGAA